MDPAQRFADAWRARCGLRPLDHPTFSGVSSVWRVELHPAQGDDVAITVSDLDAGGFVEVRALDRAGRDHAMIDAGLAPWTRPLPEVHPRVWEAAVTADALRAMQSRLPRLPLHSEAPGADGMVVHHEARVEGVHHRFASWSPSPVRAPLHYAFVLALCDLAVRATPESGAVIHPLARYLR